MNNNYNEKDNLKSLYYQIYKTMTKKGLNIIILGEYSGKKKRKILIKQTKKLKQK